MYKDVVRHARHTHYSRNTMTEKMKTIEESVVIKMDGSEKELFPFLPYILQDLRF